MATPDPSCNGTTLCGGTGNVSSTGRSPSTQNTTVESSDQLNRSTDPTSVDRAARADRGEQRSIAVVEDLDLRTTARVGHAVLDLRSDDALLDPNSLGDVVRLHVAH